MKCKEIAILLVFTALFGGCVEPYNPKVINASNSYLVVDGFINVGAGPTTFKLTRSRNLYDSKNEVVEADAELFIEGENIGTFQLIEKENGLYQIDQLNLVEGQKCRLRIKRSNGREYLSDFVEVKKTPEIDSITWEENSKGVDISVTTHDPQSNTHYYRWEYYETWEFNTPFDSQLKYESGKLIERAPEESIYTCWQYDQSTSILIGASTHLSQDIIYKKPLVFVPINTNRLSKKYSILVRQFALTREAYEYFEMLKKNTESVGSLFDPQPSRLTGNIHNINDADEPVIGLVTAGASVEKRIFIEISEIKYYNNIVTGYKDKECAVSQTFYTEDILPGLFEHNNYIPLWIHPFWNILYFTENICANCKLKGDSYTIRPEYWQ